MVYPVKACKGTSLPKALVTPTGARLLCIDGTIIEGLRKLMLFDEVQAFFLTGTGWSSLQTRVALSLKETVPSE